ncbi:ESX secretion-associated protein EspG [Saccharothrix longispora]|uniref:ESAT-6 protein secretion system EspG family protein n=1 Tax=Saccharothrix longispora TaxID=33920 RepID=A0ABU1PM01_9PSEU|nr:ESX secretion-associated protein EspG [Saccharothrix longispora]MDR6591687.1 hypothetical protein [Saccharothrix longispora]
MGTILTLPQFDVLWEDLRVGAVPYPLEVDHHGTTLDERARVRADVRADLERRGLFHRGRPDPDLEGSLLLLARPETAIAVMGLPDTSGDDLLRALVVARGRQAVLAVQRADGVRLDVLRDASLPVVAVGVLPPAPAGPGRPVTVPASAAGPRGGAAGVARGGVHDDVRALRSMLSGPVTGTGHFATTRESGDAPPVVTWIDTPRGRYASSGTEWLTVTPADHTGLVRRLGQALASRGR